MSFGRGKGGPDRTPRVKPVERIELPDKFPRRRLIAVVLLVLLAVTAIFSVWGFGIGLALIVVLIATNETVNGSRSYLYPLIPFDGKALCRLLFRVKKGM